MAVPIAFASALASRAKSYLLEKPPRQGGFFFGGKGARECRVDRCALFAVTRLAVVAGHVMARRTGGWARIPWARPLLDHGKAVSQTDVITSEAALRYADALIALAEDSRGALKGVERDMKSLGHMFKASPDLLRMVRSPVISADDKTKALMAVGKTDGFHPLTGKFLGTVAGNLRAHELPAIVRAFGELLAKKRGAKIARVTSAVKLAPAQVKSLKDKLSKELGGKVELETVVDPDLLGGFVVRIGSRLYDSSLRTQLDDLKLALKA